MTVCAEHSGTSLTSPTICQFRSPRTKPCRERPVCRSAFVPIQVCKNIMGGHIGPPLQNTNLDFDFLKKRTVPFFKKIIRSLYKHKGTTHRSFPTIYQFKFPRVTIVISYRLNDGLGAASRCEFLQFLGDRKIFAEVSNFAVGLPEDVQRYVEWRSLEVAMGI